jgi:hypothetical protein
VPKFEILEKERYLYEGKIEDVARGLLMFIQSF